MPYGVVQADGGALLEAVTSRAESHNCDDWDRFGSYRFTIRTFAGLSERITTFRGARAIER